MVEQPVGNGFEDAAVGECIVEGGDLGEGFGVVGGNPFQLAAVLESRAIEVSPVRPQL